MCAHYSAVFDNVVAESVAVLGESAFCFVHDGVVFS